MNRLGIVIVVIITAVILNNWKNVSPYDKEDKCSCKGIVVNEINQQQEDRNADVEDEYGSECENEAEPILSLKDGTDSR